MKIERQFFVYLILYSKNYLSTNPKYKSNKLNFKNCRTILRKLRKLRKTPGNKKNLQRSNQIYV